MPYAATVFNVMIASPSDVQQEHDVIRRAIDEWNRLHAPEWGTVLQRLHWQADAHPDLADNAQAIVNEQLVAQSDLLVAVFWTRLGSPTASSLSGTIDEVEQHLRDAKPVMMYFSDAARPPSQYDPDQFTALQACKHYYMQLSLVSTYGTLAEFEVKIRSGLTHMARRLSKQTAPGDAERAPDVHLSPEAQELVAAAAHDERGYIVVVESLGGMQIQVGGRHFAERGDPRSEALWKEAIGELMDRGLVDGTGRGVMQLTAAGYRVADELAAKPAP
ncbi:MAG: DUF4062 domain-containing protein [Dehalococcoidia bacterium]|nr:DUF4062 domain-containing protein [Dehalococcoidia bacterium]